MPNIDDPFRLISLAVDHDEHKPNAIELLQVPLETGKLYHNEKLLSQALSRLRKESRSFRLGWSMPFASSRNKRSKEKQNLNDHGDETATRTTTNDEHQQHQQQTETNQAKHSSRSAAAAAAAAATALTPVILSGLLATLDDSNFRAQSNSSSSNSNMECACCAPVNYQDSIQAITMATSSAELVNYTVAMRRAALSRVRLRIKRERTQKIVKPVLAITTILCLYCYAWSSLQRLLVGFYGVTDIVFVTPTPTEISGSGSNNSNDVIELRVEMLRLITSSCRSRANADHYGYLSDYAKACRITEATTFELLTSPHNSRHTKLFARTAYDDIDAEVEPEHSAADADVLNRDEGFAKFSAALMQYDDDYGDDTELPFYAMHTTLCDSESSIISLEDVIHGARRQERIKRQKQRWRRRRKRHQKYKQQQQQQQRNNDGFDGADNSSDDDIAAAHATLSRAVEFWGDTTVNRLVREAIVEAHYKAAPTLASSTKSIKGTSGSSSSSSSNNKLKLLDVGSGLSGTLFSLCTPDFPFEDWSYHGIAISQPEVRRAKQLVDKVVRPIISSASASASSLKTESSQTTENGNRSVVPKRFPISNITIQRASFDDPLPSKEYTTMVAIESLAFSHNITKTLMNLARSLKPQGTLIVIEDVVAPWAAVAKIVNDDNSSNDSDDKDYVEIMAKLSGKPSLLTHDQWLEHFAAADLDLHRPPRDLLLEFDAWSLNTPSKTTATAVTGLPFVGILLGERPWYSTGHGVLKSLIDWFGSSRGDGDVEDDGNLSNRALSLMEDMMKNEQGNAYRRAAHHRADLGYYMYVCTKRS